MSRTLKILFLLSLFNFAGCFCDCEKYNIQPYIDINGFDVSVKRIEPRRVGNSIIYPSVEFDTAESVAYDKLVIDFKAFGNYYSCNQPKFKNPFINAAYACSCEGNGEGGSKERLASITIFSSQLFKASGTVADTLNAFFDIEGRNGKYYAYRTSLEIFTDTATSTLTDFQLYLRAKPTGSLEHKFTIIYEQTNGEIYQLTTPTIRFKP